MLSGLPVISELESGGFHLRSTLQIRIRVGGSCSQGMEGNQVQRTLARVTQEGRKSAEQMLQLLVPAPSSSQTSMTKKSVTRVVEKLPSTSQICLPSGSTMVQ